MKTLFCPASHYSFEHTSLRRVLVTTALCGSLVVGITPSLALAQATTVPVVSTTDTVSTTAIPTRLEVSANPGDVIQKTIKVHNETDQTEFFETTAEDFIVQTDGKTPIPVTEQISARYSLASWITVSPTRFTLPAHQTQTLDVLIQVPKNALPGGHYAMILHAPPSGGLVGNDALLPQSDSSVAPKVGTLVYLTVNGPIHEEAFIKNVTAPNVNEFGPVAIKYDVENRSDVHISPEATITVTDMLGHTVDKINVESKNIFPFTSRDFEATYNHYWGLGRYTANISVPYGSHGNVTNSSISFWIIPYRIIAGIAVIIAALLAITIAIRRHLLHRHDDKSKEIELLKERIDELEKGKHF
ncbi:hypothetical protein C5B42_05100 [Candidatus Cerribacteria bacterium 'Amazon FNV 2010 28 9']|uniref:Uncharacterized protein n=1 Tax=Candidatus Cerribacteria bacterium 'Amazon FNV 2010 28 9' TaxID=2081795 RepID=A0A317JSL1_9BACT|nr:MAG: hypothetical protein C5B42_05100 [Candidatus Cerribacteria bacterium 'Amazon FNV 2010 28 9']